MFNIRYRQILIIIIFILLIAGAIYYYLRKNIDGNLLFGSIGSLITIFFGYIKFQIENDTMFNQLFTDFNNRYTNKQNDLLNSLRNDDEYKFKTGEKNLIYDYFNLCAEEFLWFKKGRIPKRVWFAWENGIRENLKIPIINEMFKAEILTKEGRTSFYGLPDYLGY
ncbi:MAG: hypothetical protein KDB92_08935 [Chitinophagaceae bacterium]|nr:hypothetical protein [Chitinophagaceae bacterium]